LLLPPLALIGLLAFWPAERQLGQVWRGLWRRQNVLIYAGFLAMLLPLYLQAKYGVVSGNSGVNATGNLHELHYLLLLAGVAVVAWVGGSARFAPAFRSSVITVFGSFFLMLTPLVVLQYFTTGEVRYYPVKISLIIELLIMAVAVASLVYAFSQLTIANLRTAIFVPLLPITLGILFISPIANPLREVRELLKDYSSMEKPAYYDPDTAQYVSLGLAGKIQSYNTMSLHYTERKQIFEGYMQLPYWLNQADQLKCNDKIYANLAYGMSTPKEQADLMQYIKMCAAYAKSQGLSYYIVTDRLSANRLRPLVGNDAVLRY
jgi:hypothetical protein